MCSQLYLLLVGLVLLQQHTVGAAPIESKYIDDSLSVQKKLTDHFQGEQDQLKADCCLSGRKYATIKQDAAHFIQLDQLNLDRRRRTNKFIDQTARQTNLVKLFAKLHLNRHFYTNSSVCERAKHRNATVEFRLPAAPEECQFEFTNCCLDEQLLFATGIDLAFRTRFKQQTSDGGSRTTNKEESNGDSSSQSDNDEIEYSISDGGAVRLSCLLLVNNNKTNRSSDEQLNSLVKSLRIGQNVAYDACEACSFGIDAHDQFENCNQMSRLENQNPLFFAIFKQCCRVIHLSKLADGNGVIKLRKPGAD